MTLNDLLKTLKTMTPQAAVVFSTQEAVIGGGYHVSELKAARITSIDCAGRTSEWNEAVVQLLDGPGGAHMSVGKFVRILENSLSKLEALKDVPALVEFAPGNAGLRRFSLDIKNNTADRVDIQLSDEKAVCKPAFAFAGRAGDHGAKAPANRCCS